MIHVRGSVQNSSHCLKYMQFSGDTAPPGMHSVMTCMYTPKIKALQKDSLQTQMSPLTVDAKSSVSWYTALPQCDFQGRKQTNDPCPARCTHQNYVNHHKCIHCMHLLMGSHHQVLSRDVSLGVALWCAGPSTTFSQPVNLVTIPPSS